MGSLYDSVLNECLWHQKVRGKEKLTNMNYQKYWKGIGLA